MPFLDRWLGRKRPSPPEVDYDTFPGIGHHIDYSRRDEKGNLKVHATFAPNSTPQSMADAFNELAENLLANPPKNIKPEVLEELVKTLRGEARDLTGE